MAAVLGPAVHVSRIGPFINDLFKQLNIIVNLISSKHAYKELIDKYQFAY